MLTVEQICKTALQLCGRGDKPDTDDMALALRTMNIITADWAATRDVLFWNVAEDSFDVPIGDRVTGTDGNVYQCIVPHVADDDNCPVTGDQYLDYWKASPHTDGAVVWASGTSYDNSQYYQFSDSYLEDILATKLQLNGQFSTVEKVGAMEFLSLTKDEIGEPTKLWFKKEGSFCRAYLWPLNPEANAKIFFYSVKRPYESISSDLFSFPDQWAQALYYALAVELGFMYNISLERLNVLGQKARFEFDKAFRSNESETDECYVKPLY